MMKGEGDESCSQGKQVGRPSSGAVGFVSFYATGLGRSYGNGCSEKFPSVSLCKVLQMPVSLIGITA